MIGADADAGQRIFRTPRLIGIDQQRMIGGNRRADRTERTAVHLGAETNLQLERSVAAGGEGPRDLDRCLRPDAAGIGADFADARAAEKTPQRQTGFSRREVVARRIDARRHLTKRPPLAGLNGHDVQALHQIREHAVEFTLAALDQDGPDDFPGQPSPMFGAHGRKVAPDFAEPFGAVGIRHPQIHRRPVPHHPKRSAYRHRDRGANDPGFDPGYFYACRLVHPAHSPPLSPCPAIARVPSSGNPGPRNRAGSATVRIAPNPVSRH